MSGAVFLSYASQDAEAVRRIASALRAAGVEVWFDQSELVGGDAWDQKIRGQIAACALFVPVISAAAQARREGYFRLEWKLAAQRTHMIADGTPFLFPVVIDDTREAEALVPAEFKAVQWTKLLRGGAADSFAVRVKKLLEGDSGMEAASSRAAPRDEGVTPPLKTHSPRWIKPVLASAVLVASILAVTLIKRSAREVTEKPSGMSSPSTETREALSPARKLANKAQTAIRSDATGPELGAAISEAERATTMDNLDGEIWAISALVDLSAYEMLMDRSTARRDAIRAKVDKATGLAPRSPLTRYARAKSLVRLDGTPDSLVVALEILERLRAENPREPDALKILGLIGLVQQEQGNYQEAGRTLEQAGPDWANAASWAWLAGGNLDRALAMAQRQTITDAIGGRLQEINVQFARGDLAAVKAILNGLPPAARMGGPPLGMALGLAYLDRDAATILDLARRFPTPFFDNQVVLLSPRGYYVGQAYAWLGRAEAARAEWTEALRQVEERQAAEGASDALRVAHMFLLVRLGRNDAATRELEVFRQQFHNYSSGPVVVGLLTALGRTDAALEEMEGLMASGHLNVGWSHHPLFRYDPEYEPLRSNPRFQKILRDTLLPGAKPFDDANSAAAAPPLANSKSVAVLAFANLSDDKDNEYFSDGISEELLNVLAKIPALKVSARTSAFYFKGKQVPIAEIAKQLGVAYVIEGSVRKSGDKVRITAQLIKAADGFHVWSDTFTRELKDIFALQDEIAGLIAQNLSLKLGMSPASATREVDPEAYRLMLLGRSLAYQATPAGWKQGLLYLEESIRHDEKFAQAWVWLSMTHWISASSGWEPFESGFKAAREAAQRALSLQPDLPEAESAMGLMYYGYDWDWARARASFQHAALLAPGDASVVSNLARLAITVAQTDESVQLGRRAVELDPLNSYVQYALCMAYLQAGRFAELEKQAAQFKDLSRAGLKFQALTYLLQGRNEQALQVAEQIQLESPRLFLLTVAQWALRQSAESDASLAQLKAKYSASAGYQIAEAYALRGAHDEAFEWLEASYRARDTGMIWLKNDPMLKNLHDDPRWVTMLRKMNLADDQLK